MTYKGFKIEKQIRLAKNGREYTEGYNITFPNEKYPSEWALKLKYAKQDVDYWAMFHPTK